MELAGMPRRASFAGAWISVENRMLYTFHIVSCLRSRARERKYLRPVAYAEYRQHDEYIYKIQIQINHLTIRPAMKTNRISSLDDFRAIAVSLVVIMHGYAAFFEKPEDLNLAQVIIFSGGTGVILFFVLSGLLVTKPFLQAFKYRELYSIKEYITQRALRIVPLYYFWVAIAALLTGAYNNVPAALLFQSSGIDFGLYSAVWWSLNVEVQFYIIVPLIFYTGARYGSTCMAALLLFIILIYVAWAGGSFIKWPAIHYGMDNSIIGKLPAFAAGFLCATLIPLIKNKRKILFWLRLTGIPVISSCLFLTLEHRAYNTNFLAEANNPQWPLIESLCWGGLVLLLGSSDYSVFGRFSAFLSRISYSLYLSHVPVIFFILLIYKSERIFFLEALGPLGTLSLAIGTSLLISWITFHLIEKPFLRLKDKLRKTGSPASLGLAAATASTQPELVQTTYHHSSEK